MSEPRIYTERQMCQAKYEARKQAEQFYEVRINQFKAVILEEFECCTDMDKYEPLNGIFVPYDLCKRIEAYLRKINPRNIYANKLKHWMNKSDYEMLVRWERVGMLDEVERKAQD